MEIRFHITREKFEQITWDEWCAIEAMSDGVIKPSDLRALAIRMMVDEKNQPLPETDARKLLGKTQLIETLKQLAASIEGYAVPKENGNAS